MIIAGVMSGTSADGINVALVRFSAGTGRAKRPSPHKHHPQISHFLLTRNIPFPAPVRRAILEMMNAELARVADLARLNFLLGELYAEAVAKTARKHRVKLDLVGCHGQTLYHQGKAERFLGRKLAVTWQTGEGAVIAARLGVPVVSDFRPADMAAGGRVHRWCRFSISFFIAMREWDASRATAWRRAVLLKTLAELRI